MFVGGPSALDEEVFRDQKLADPLAEIPLQLDAVFADGPPGAARTLELLSQIFQKSGVVGKTEDHGDGLPAAAGFLDAQLRDRPVGHGCRRLFGALTAALGLATSG